MGVFWIMLDELRKVQVQASSTQLASDLKCTGMFLHVTFQELRVLKKFKEAILENHPQVWSKMVTRLFSTYVPKTELGASMACTCLIQMKCRMLEKQVTGTKGTIDVNMLLIGELQKELNPLKHKKLGSGVRVGDYFNGQLVSPLLTPSFKHGLTSLLLLQLLVN